MVRGDRWRRRCRSCGYARAAAAREEPDLFADRPRQRRRIAARLSYAGRTLAPSRLCGRRGPEILRRALRLRGQALLLSSRRRSARHAARGIPVGNARRDRLRRFDHIHASRAPSGATPQALALREIPPDGARRSARTGVEQAEDPIALPDARALWRKSGRHPRRFLRLFRQGTAATHAWRDGVAGRPAPVAGISPSGPPPQSRAGRPQSRSRPYRRERIVQRRRAHGRKSRTGSHRAQIHAARCAARVRRCQGGILRSVDHPPDHQCAPAAPA